MKRRTFITFLGGAAAWPFATRAQQPAMPVIGYLIAGPSRQGIARLQALLRQILAEASYVEGRNLTIESRYAEGQYDRLPALAAELVQRHAAVMIAGTTPAALGAKAATAIRSCSTPPMIRSALASSPAWRGRAATSPDCRVRRRMYRRIQRRAEISQQSLRRRLTMPPQNSLVLLG